MRSVKGILCGHVCTYPYCRSPFSMFSQHTADIFPARYTLSEFPQEFWRHKAMGNFIFSIEKSFIKVKQFCFILSRYKVWDLSEWNVSVRIASLLFTPMNPTSTLCWLTMLGPGRFSHVFYINFCLFLIINCLFSCENSKYKFMILKYKFQKYLKVWDLPSVLKIPNFSLKIIPKLPIKSFVFLQPVGSNLIGDFSGEVLVDSTKIF